MKKDGSISLDIVHEVFKEIDSVLDYEAEHQPTILLRSTVTPGTTRKIQQDYSKMYIVFNPEFLTERSAKLDFINQSRFVLGGNWGSTTKVQHLYQWRFGKHIPVVKTNFETAELIKYMNNCFFATKVSFMNEMKLISDKIGAKWEDCVDGFSLDGRVGHSHLNVPGPDGKMGFGGSCFPKDVRAMTDFMKSLDIEPCVLEGTWKTNLNVRPEEDWKELKGRAIEDE
jgi:UDPglucose 6-dehydrogenase